MQNPLLASESLRRYASELPLPVLRHGPPSSDVLTKLGINIEPAAELAREADLVATLAQVAEIRAAVVQQGLITGAADGALVAAGHGNSGPRGLLLQHAQPQAAASPEAHAHPRLLSSHRHGHGGSPRVGVPSIHTAVARLDAVSRSRDFQSPEAVKELKRATEDLRRAARGMADSRTTSQRGGSASAAASTPAAASAKSPSWWMMQAIEATGGSPSGAGPQSAASPPGKAAPAEEGTAVVPSAAGSPEGAASPAASRPPMMRSPSRRDLVIIDEPDEFGEFAGPRTRIGASPPWRTNKAAMLRRSASMGGAAHASSSSSNNNGGGGGGRREVAHSHGRLFPTSPRAASKTREQEEAEEDAEFAAANAAADAAAAAAKAAPLALTATASAAAVAVAPPSRGRSLGASAASSRAPSAGRDTGAHAAGDEEATGEAGAQAVVSQSSAAAVAKPAGGLPRMNSRSTAGVVYRIDYKLHAGGYGGKGRGGASPSAARLALPDKDAARPGSSSRSGSLVARTPVGPLPVPVPLPAAATAGFAPPGAAATPASRGRPGASTPAAAASAATTKRAGGSKQGQSSWTVVMPAAGLNAPAAAAPAPTAQLAAPAAAAPPSSPPVPAALARVLLRNGPPPLLHTVRSALTAELRAAATAASPSKSPARATSLTRS